LSRMHSSMPLRLHESAPNVHVSAQPEYASIQPARFDCADICATAGGTATSASGTRSPRALPGVRPRVPPVRAGLP